MLATLRFPPAAQAFVAEIRDSRILPARLIKAPDDPDGQAWVAVDSRLRPVETMFERAIYRAHLGAIDELHAALIHDMSLPSAIGASRIVLHRLLVKAGVELLPLVVRHGWHRGVRQIREAKKSFPGFDLSAVESYLLRRPRQYSPAATNATIDRFRAALIAGVDRGLGSEDLAREVANLELPLIARSRARVIARTEVISGTNYGAFESYRASGVVERKQWLWTRDERTRDSHKNVAPVDLDKPFVLSSGARLMHPGDSSLGAPLKEIAQCRCAVAPLVTL